VDTQLDRISCVSLRSDPRLARAITKASSTQTYYTFRFLVDKSLVDDAYRAYAYFRWLDDLLDEGGLSQSECLALVQRQQALIDDGYRGRYLTDLTPEEDMLADLIQHDLEVDSGLQAYLRNMMAVMDFDARRRGSMVTQRELDEYTHWLAVAVTEFMHYFIGHNCASPQDETRYLAVTGAHLTHMLRDAMEDAEAGYYNVPREVIAGYDRPFQEIKSEIYRDWIEQTVGKARTCFKVGRDYLSRVECMRCRIAGYAYIHRFEVVLKSIERENYVLRTAYPERKGKQQMMGMLSWALWMALSNRKAATIPSTTLSR
jgi:phytoene/squalene synthetase